MRGGEEEERRRRGGEEGKGYPGTLTKQQMHYGWRGKQFLVNMILR